MKAERKIIFIKILILVLFTLASNIFVHSQENFCDVQVNLIKQDSNEKIDNYEVQIINLDKQILYRRNVLRANYLFEDVLPGKISIGYSDNKDLVEFKKFDLSCINKNEDKLVNFSISIIEKKSTLDTKGFSGIDESNQQDLKTKESSRVINGGAKNLETPKYPKSAVAANVKGSVFVRVIIDQEGNVVFAKAVEGHPLLRQASENAAVKSKFATTLLEGQPVEVSGIIVYNFN